MLSPQRHRRWRAKRATIPPGGGAVSVANWGGSVKGARNATTHKIPEDDKVALVSVVRAKPTLPCHRGLNCEVSELTL